MIKADQPTIFGQTIKAAVSSVDDGNMKFGIGVPDQVWQNRRAFLRKVGINPEHTTLVSVTYDTDDFAKYRVASHHDKADGMEGIDHIEHADALVVDQPNHALFLPLADCVGAILYDPIKCVLMVSHLGRHSTEISGAAKSVQYLVERYGTNAGDLLVWLSPAVGGATYPLRAFGGRGLHDVIVQQLQDVGVSGKKIEESNINTAVSPDYFSHSEFLKGSKTFEGRFAITAMMMDVQGKPAA